MRGQSWSVVLEPSGNTGELCLRFARTHTHTHIQNTYDLTESITFLSSCRRLMSSVCSGSCDSHTASTVPKESPSSTTVWPWLSRLISCHQGVCTRTHTHSSQICVVKGTSKTRFFFNDFLKSNAHLCNDTIRCSFNSLHLCVRMVCAALISSDNLEWERTQLWALTFGLIRKIIGGVDYKVSNVHVCFFIFGWN